MKIFFFAGQNLLEEEGFLVSFGVGRGGGRDQQPNSGGESCEEENAEKKDFGKS